MTTLEAALGVVVREALREVVREELGRVGQRTDGPEYLSKKAAAKMLGVSTDTITAWAKRGLRMYGEGRTKRYRVAELRAWMEGLGDKTSGTMSLDEHAARLLGSLEPRASVTHIRKGR